MKKIFSIFIIIIMTFRNVSIIAYSEESTNLTMFTIPILSNSRIEKIDAYVNINTLENNTEILITTNDFAILTQMEEVNKSKAIKILDKNGLDIVGLVYDIEKERENISVDEYYKCLNIGLVEEGLEWLDYDSDSIEYIVLEKKLQKGADKFQQAIIDELKSIDSNTLKSVGTLESIVNGIGHIITMTGIAIDTLEVEIEREQEKYIIETIFNDIKKAEYTQEYFSLLSNSILQEYQYYAIEDNVDINNRKEFSEYMKNHKYAYRNGVSLYLTPFLYAYL